jgi:hypothetical protein
MSLQSNAPLPDQNILGVRRQRVVDLLEESSQWNQPGNQVFWESKVNDTGTATVKIPNILPVGFFMFIS